MKNLYIDFDGVIMDTIPVLNKAIEDKGVSIKNDKEVQKIIADFDFKTILIDENIIADAFGAIRELIKSGKYNVSILTHINSLQEGIDKTRFVRRFLRDITMILVPKQISKTQMVRSKDAILVDDYPGNLEEWESHGGIGVKFTDNLKPKDYIRINDLRCLLSMFDKNINE